ncbi:MAG: hypothetical protein CMJ96_08195 [Planctomycetes bacterium]|jgi:ABC-type transport system involved in cytochrome c biogenesis permease subunit|nr:hypothetical protein [Planctomycetota bacterium]|tara:strand:- start:11996 stop:13123 length:1128 start_codon:yes stop_codon:yes gene_type:complete
MDPLSYRALIQDTLYFALAGGVLGLLTTFGWFLQPAWARKREHSLHDSEECTPRFLNLASRFLALSCVLAFFINLAAQISRYIEVKHWPAQTMYEVIPLGTTTAFLSVVVLYFVLGLNRARGVARAFGDLFIALVMLGCASTLKYVLGLDPSGKALPPALQSYWFSTHISAYMFGYFTLFIATLAAWLHFCFKFWRGTFQASLYPVPARTKLAIIFFALVPVPFGSQGILMGPGVLLITFLVSLLSLRGANKMAWFDSWENGSDRFTWLIFVVGFPFLTAGLIQGSLWAHESWAFYWGWDSKEVSALISWLFYLIYLHLRYVAGWRGEKGMWILLFGGISIYITFQLFGDLPASQSSLHRYTDMDSVPAERLMQE